jgi:hypothetical protein
MSINGLLFQWASTIQIQLRVLVNYKADLIIISLKTRYDLDYGVPNWFPTSKNFYRSPFSKWLPQYRKNSTLFDFKGSFWFIFSDLQTQVMKSTDTRIPDPPFFLIWSLLRLWYGSLSGSISLSHLSIFYNISFYNTTITRCTALSRSY